MTDFRPDMWVPSPATGCWEWLGHLNAEGRARVRRNGKVTNAARASFAHYFGEIPAGAHVLHRCDSPKCVNPAHLFLGDQKTNMQDMVQKGRHKPRGLVMAAGIHDTIVKALNGAESQRAIAARLGVSQQLVSKVNRRRAAIEAALAAKEK